MRFVLMLLLLLAPSVGRGAAPDTITYRPGRWTRVQVSTPGEIPAPGAATVVGHARADAQYVLPMSEPWVAALDGSKSAVTSIPNGAWLVVEAGPASHGAARDGILKALPEGSILTGLGDIGRGVPEAVDLIICHDFAESRLQPGERAAVEAFIRRGGAVVMLFASREIPAASEDLWRSLFGAGEARDKQAPGLPRGLLVPNDFQTRLDVPDPAGESSPLTLDDLRALADRPEASGGQPFVWQPCGRGIVMAARRTMLDRSEDAERFFRRVARRARSDCRPINLGPVQPDVFRLFDQPGWSAQPRHTFAVLAAAYSIAAVGLLLSFRSALARRRWAWLAAAILVAAGGVGIVLAFTGGASGLALDTASILIVERGKAPVAVDFARIARLGSGGAPELVSADAMPPRLLLYSRHAASAKAWVKYRFLPDRSTVEPVLDIGQSLCVSSVRRVPNGSAAGPGASPPKNAEALIELFKSRWAKKGTDYVFRWARAQGPRLFTVAAEGRFVQIDHGPVLVVTERAAGPALTKEGGTTMEKAMFGAGCFWGVEAAFREVKGVVDVAAGYSGGTLDNPTYRDVCGKTTGHAEVVEVTYDPAEVSYERLLDVFWGCHDPTQVNRQGPDVGSQYRSAIFTHTPEQQAAAEASKKKLEDAGTHDRPVATEITPASTFWRAEESHQRYFEKHGGACKVK